MSLNAPSSAMSFIIKARRCSSTVSIVMLPGMLEQRSEGLSVVQGNMHWQISPEIAVSRRDFVKQHCEVKAIPLQDLSARDTGEDDVDGAQGRLGRE